MRKQHTLYAKALFGTLILVFNLLAPPPALAVSGDTTIDLTDTSVTSGTGWAYAPATNTYDISGDVTIIGTILDASSTLTLNISDTATAYWSAKYASTSAFHDTLVSLPGDGTLSMSEFSHIRNTGAGVAIRSTGASAELHIAGVIDSQTGGAIRADGIAASIVVDGGSITASGTSTVQPTIYMYNQNNDNTSITVKGSSFVAATAFGAPAIQTYGSVLVEDIATIYQVGGSGAGKGPTINALGPSSSVTVTGGSVWSDSGTAIHTDEPGASINISGGQVYSRTGTRAIYAEDASSTVAVSGGLVFANNTATHASSSGALAVVNSSHLATDPAGVIIAWDSSASAPSYTAGTGTGLTLYPATASAEWQIDDDTHGISYYDATRQTIGFLHIPSILVTPAAQTLYFDTTAGQFYTDSSLTVPYTGQSGLWSWDSPTSTLSLNGFNWTTLADYALYVTGGDITLDLSGSNSFISQASASTTTGILSDYDITIAGTGTLSAVGGTASPGNNSYGINATNVILSSGTLTAQGDTMAIFNFPPDTTTVSAPDYTYWTSTTPAAPSGEGTTYIDGTTDPAAAYTRDIAHKYIKIQSLTEVTFVATQTGGRSHSADSTGIVLSFDRPIADLTSDDILIINSTGQAIEGDLAGFGSTWTIELADVLAEGDISVFIDSFGAFFVSPATQTTAIYMLAAASAVSPEDFPNSTVPGTGTHRHSLTTALPAHNLILAGILGSILWLILRKRVKPMV